MSEHGTVLKMVLSSNRNKPFVERCVGAGQVMLNKFWFQRQPDFVKAESSKLKFNIEECYLSDSVQSVGVGYR